MNINEFIKEIENYYGKDLNESQRGYVRNYLSVYEQKKLVKLLSVVMMYHSISFGTPGMAVIEQAHRVYQFGDDKKKIPGHETLKIVRTVSATAPVEEPMEEMATEEDIRLLTSILSGKEKYNGDGQNEPLGLPRIRHPRSHNRT